MTTKPEQVGMLWDFSKSSDNARKLKVKFDLVAEIRKAVAYYEEKYTTHPEIVWTNAANLALLPKDKNGLPLPIDHVDVQATPNLGKWYIWIGMKNHG